MVSRDITSIVGDKISESKPLRVLDLAIRARIVVSALLKDSSSGSDCGSGEGLSNTRFAGGGPTVAAVFLR
jgi:hypothetical protein